VRVQRVALDKLVIPEVRVNAQYTPEELAVLAGNLSTEGQKQPILVVHSGESYIVTDGRHRVEQAKARGGGVMAVVTDGDSLMPSKSDHTLFVPEVSWMLSPVLTVIPLQMLAYHIAVLRGCDVDQPRNLAKSVTVE